MFSFCFICRLLCRTEDVLNTKLVFLRNKLRSIRLVWVTAVALQLLLNYKYMLESLQGDGSRTRQEIPQTASYKARACNCGN